MGKRILAYAVIILSVVYFYSSEKFILNSDNSNEKIKEPAENLASIYLSCSLPPLDIKVMKDWSIIATNDIDDSEEDYPQTFIDPPNRAQGTGACRSYSWVINYMGVNYQVEEIGCHPGSNFHIPNNASARLTVGGKLINEDNGDTYLEDGAQFWCY